MEKNKKSVKDTKDSSTIDVEIIDNPKSSKEDKKKEDNKKATKINFKKDKKNNKDSKEKNQNKFLLGLKDFVFSTFKTDTLFKYAHKKFWIPLLVILIIISYLIFAPLTLVKQLDAATIVKQSHLLNSDKVINHVLQSNIPCSIKNGHLACTPNQDGSPFKLDEMYNPDPDNNLVNEYNVFVNIMNLTEYKNDTDTEYFNVDSRFHKPGDNYLVFHDTSIQIRYVERNSNGNHKIYKTILLYKDLEGTDFAKIYKEAPEQENEKETYYKNHTNEIIEVGFKSFLQTGVMAQSVNNIVSILSLFLLSALILKGRYLFIKKKGFSYGQSFKIVSVSALQSFLIALLFAIFGVDLMTIFGLAFVIRILYLWIRYTSSSTRVEWCKKIYEETKDERFNLSNVK